jgi:hypothetical protein
VNSSSSSGSTSSSSSSEPTLEEVIRAEEEYNLWSRKVHTKQKYTDFHAANFARLKQAAREGKWESMTGGGGGGSVFPQTIHFG